MPKERILPFTQDPKRTTDVLTNFDLRGWDRGIKQLEAPELKLCTV